MSQNLPACTQTPQEYGRYCLFIVSQEVGRTRSDLSKQSKVTAGIPWRVLSFMTVSQREKAELMAQTCNPWGVRGYSGRRMALAVLDSVGRENKHLGLN